MSRIKGVIFDMDGLLLDSERLFQESWRMLADRHGVTLGPAFSSEIIGCGETQAQEVLRRYFPGEDPKKLIEDCKENVARLEETQLVLKKGVRETLSGMRAAGMRLAVASSSPMWMIRQNLARMGIASYFDVLYSGENVKRGKPFPDLFLLTAEELCLEPGDCYVFEDSLNGIEAAHAAHCRPVMIPDQVPPTEEIRKICEVYPDLLAAWREIQKAE